MMPAFDDVEDAMVDVIPIRDDKIVAFVKLDDFCFPWLQDCLDLPSFKVQKKTVSTDQVT